MSVNEVIRGIQKCQVPYFNHANQQTQGNTVPQAIHFLSIGNSHIRKQLDRIEEKLDTLIERGN